MSSWHVSKKLTRTTENQSKDVNFRRIQSVTHQWQSQSFLSKAWVGRGGSVKGTGFYTELFHEKKRTTSVVAKNLTFLHEDGELEQCHFPKATITLNALVAIYTSIKAGKRVTFISYYHSCNTATLWNDEIVKNKQTKHQLCSAVSVAWGNYKQQRHAIEIRIMTSWKIGLLGKLSKNK